jgi:periplasmic divalent cation tolerance protein
VPTAYVTAPPEAAERLARALVEERLAACVNRVDATSTYRWEGRVHEEAEVVLLAKTTAGRYDALERRVRELHPHEVPCVERFEEADVLDAFADWRAAAVAPGGGSAGAGDAGDSDGVESDGTSGPNADADADADANPDGESNPDADA